MSVLFRLFFVLASLAGIPFQSTHAVTLPVDATQRSRLGIRVAEVVASAQAPGLSAMAQVVLPPTAVQVVAASGMGLVTRLHVEAGQTVRAGTALVTLSMPGLAEANNAWIQANLRARLAADTLARDRRLFDEGLIAESRLRASEVQMEAARAERVAAEAARALLGSGRVSGSRLTLVAPAAGVVAEIQAEPGMRVDAGAPLVKLVDPGRLALDIALSTTQAEQVGVGQQVKAVGGSARGVIEAILPRLDAAQSVRVRARLSETGNLRVGQTVAVEIIGARQGDAVLVPVSALVWQGNRPWVFVAKAKGFTPTLVRVLRQSTREVELVGLVPGTRIAVAGVAALKAQWDGE